MSHAFDRLGHYESIARLAHLTTVDPFDRSNERFRFESIPKVSEPSLIIIIIKVYRLLFRIISIIAECSSSDDRALVNNAYLCLNHCLEQLIRFCDDALFFDSDEEQAIRKVYKKFGYPIIPLPIDTTQLLNRFSSDTSARENTDKEIYLTSESSTSDKVLFYVHHLRILLKTSDQQHITAVSDFDDALLQFSSFISNGKSFAYLL